MRVDVPIVCDANYFRQLPDGRRLFRCLNCDGIFVVPHGAAPEDHCPLRQMQDWQTRIEAATSQRALPLGDWLAATLAAIGITKHRWARLHGKPCQCWRRQTQLNQLGFRLSKMLNLVK